MLMKSEWSKYHDHRWWLHTVLDLTLLYALVAVLGGFSWPVALIVVVLLLHNRYVGAYEERNGWR